MYYTVIKHNRHLRTQGKCRKHEPQASVFYISRVFSNVGSVLSQCNTWLKLLHLLHGIIIVIPWQWVSFYLYRSIWNWSCTFNCGRFNSIHWNRVFERKGWCQFWFRYFDVSYYVILWTVLKNLKCFSFKLISWASVLENILHAGKLGLILIRGL